MGSHSGQHGPALDRCGHRAGRRGEDSVSCERCFCKHCGEEMIHRDNRRPHESSSAFGQIVHREGPSAVAFGDVDSYAEKWFGSASVLRVIEHKQPKQRLGDAQRTVLTHLDEAIRHAVTCERSTVKLLDGSGVFLIRGRVGPNKDRVPDFLGPQTITRITGEVIEAPRTRASLWNWLNCGKDWKPRAGAGRKR